MQYDKKKQKQKKKKQKKKKKKNKTKKQQQQKTGIYSCMLMRQNLIGKKDLLNISKQIQTNKKPQI